MAADNDSRFYVYVHRRKTDNTIFYVGKGCRYRYKNTHRNAHWKNIVNKHGFTWEVVHKNLTEQQAIDFEVSLIAHIGREKLCNMTNGGEGMAGYIVPQSRRELTRKIHLGRKRSKETCRKISESLKGRELTEASRIKISEKLKGQVLSEVTKQRMSASRIGKKYSEEWRANMSKSWDTTPELYKKRCDAMALANEGKKVICLETGVVYEKMKKAVEWIKSLNISKNPSHSKISMCCSGKRSQAYGYRWQYVNE